MVLYRVVRTGFNKTISELSGMESARHITAIVTGAGGFVGRSLVDRLVIDGCRVIAIGRSAPQKAGIEFFEFDLAAGAPSRDYGQVDVVFHLAARVHVMNESPSEAAAKHDDVNHHGMRRLLSHLGPTRVGRFVFLSSIKVNGEGGRGIVYDEGSESAPVDAYGLSKLAAEKSLMEWADASGTAYTILRPPLVYGEGVRGNFLRLMRLVDKGFPLPFGMLQNVRSMIFRENLVDMMLRAASCEEARNRLFLCSDGDDRSVREVVLAIGEAMGRKVRLLPVPPTLLKMAGRIAGKNAEVARLCDPLIVDSSRFRAATGWVTPFSFDEGLRRTVNAWKERPW